MILRWQGGSSPTAPALLAGWCRAPARRRRNGVRTLVHESEGHLQVVHGDGQQRLEEQELVKADGVVAVDVKPGDEAGGLRRGESGAGADGGRGGICVRRDVRYAGI